MKLSLVILLSLILSACGLASRPDKFALLGYRGPLPEEHTYLSLASTTKLLSLCEKISEKALVSGLAFNPPNKKIYLLRSNCYSTYAKSNLDPTICEKVISVSNLFWSGSELNAENCKKIARLPVINGIPQIGGGEPLPTKDQFYGLLAKLGFNESNYLTMFASVENPPPSFSDFVGLLVQLRKPSPLLIEKLKSLPSSAD